MSRKLFEYFFDPGELEPFYSEITRQKPRRSKREPGPQRAVARQSPTTVRKASPTPNGKANIPPQVEVDEIEQAASKTTQAEAPAGCGAAKTWDEPDRSQSEHVAEVDVPAQGLTDSVIAHEPLQDDPRIPPEPTADRGRMRVRQMLSVHALGQYVFCPRAAILAVERGDDRDHDSRLPRLSYLPNFDLARIEEALSAKFKLLLLAVVMIGALAVSMAISTNEQTWEPFYLAAAMLFLTIFWAVHLVRDIILLSLRRAAAIHAKQKEPLEAFTGIQPVNWWSLLQAGYEPIGYNQPFQHPELPLEGHPWRVLHRDSLRIPVIRSSGNRLGDGKNRLFPKHEVRLTAYAMLLEADGFHKVPYGLVFPVDSPRGLAFAITDGHRRRAKKLLAEFAQKLVDSQQQGSHPELPTNRNRCTNCDYGKPVETSLRQVASARKAGERIIILQSRSNRLFHCQCANRFGSAPPHRDSVRMGLRAILE